MKKYAMKSSIVRKDEGKLSYKCKIIPFPVKQKQLKTYNMKCCKTDMIEWRFDVY